MPHEHGCTGQECCYCHCYHHFHHAPVPSRSHLVRRQSSLRRQSQWGPPASTDDKSASQDTVLNSAGSQPGSASLSMPAICSEDLHPTKPINGASGFLQTLGDTHHEDFQEGKAHHEIGSVRGDFQREGDPPTDLGIVAAQDLGSCENELPEHKGHGAGNGWMDTSRAC
jgi:hypothetical protein